MFGTPRSLGKSTGVPTNNKTNAKTSPNRSLSRPTSWSTWTGRSNKAGTVLKTSDDIYRSFAQIVVLLLGVLGLCLGYYTVAFVYHQPVFAALTFIIVGVLFCYFRTSKTWVHHSQHSENRFWMGVWGFITAALLFAPDSPLPIRRHLAFVPADPLTCATGVSIDMDGLMASGNVDALGCLVSAVATNTNFDIVVNVFSVALVLLVMVMAHFIDKIAHRRMLAEKPVFRRRAISSASASSVSSNSSKPQRRIGSTVSWSRAKRVMSAVLSWMGTSVWFHEPKSTIAAANQDRDEWLSGSIPSITTPPKLDGVLDLRSMSQDQKLAAISECMKELEYIFMPSMIYHYLSPQWVFRCERRILQVLRNSSQRELNYLLGEVNLRQLTYRLCNHNTTTRLVEDDDGVGDWGGESVNQYRNMFLDLVTRQRSSDLSTASRALVLDAIQVNRMMIDPNTAIVAQHAVVNLLLSTSGEDLSDLKTLMDGKGSIEGTHKLIYQDIRDPELRTKVLTHIQRQANVHKARMTMGGSIARKLFAKSAWRKVLSDVDDTLLSSGGRYPAGMDRRYGHHVLYPGVTRFYQELDLGTHPSVDDGVWPEDRQGNLVFLSARPHVYKNMTEKKVYAKFENMIHANNLHCMPALLPGDLDSGQAFMLRGNLEPMALKKLKNFEEYYSLYPEFRHVFIGDNGQADVKAGQYMVERFGDSVEKVFVHTVQPISATFGYTPESEQLWRNQGMVFFCTYVGAALEACVADAPLIRPSGLLRVCRSAVTDFEAIKFKHGRVREECRLELNADIIRANAILTSHLLPEVPVINAVLRFKIGQHVYTPFGPGYVESFRQEDGIYGVVLDWHIGLGVKDMHVGNNSSTRSMASGSIIDDNASTGDREDDNQSLSGSVFGSYAAAVPTVPKTMVYLGLDSLAGKSKTAKRRAGGKQTFFAPTIEATGQYAPGAVVTLVGGLGKGVVRRYRRHDSIFEVKMQDLPNTMCYVPERALEQRARSDSASRGGFFSLVRKLASPQSKPTPKPKLLDGDVFALGGSSALSPGSQVVTPFGTGSLTAIRPFVLDELNVDVAKVNEEISDDQLDSGESPLIRKHSVSSASAISNSMALVVSTNPEGKQREEEEEEEAEKMGTVLLEWGATVHMPVEQLQPVVVAPKTPPPRLSLFSLVSGPFDRASTMLGGGGGSSRSEAVADAPVSLSVGSKLETSFGHAQVLEDARDVDGIIHVQLPYGHAYLTQGALLNAIVHKELPRYGVTRTLFTGLFRMGGGGRSIVNQEQEGTEQSNEQVVEPDVEAAKSVNVGQVVECAFGVCVVQRVYELVNQLSLDSKTSSDAKRIDDVEEIGADIFGGRESNNISSAVDVDAPQEDGDYEKDLEIEKSCGIEEEGGSACMQMVQLELAWGGMLFMPLNLLLVDMAATAAMRSGPEHATFSLSSSIISFLSKMMPAGGASVDQSVSPALGNGYISETQSDDENLAALDVFAVGTRVHVCLLGQYQEGMVVGWRMEDCIYTVDLSFGQAYVHQSQLLAVVVTATAAAKLDPTVSPKLRRSFLSFFGLGPAAGSSEMVNKLTDVTESDEKLEVGDRVHVAGGLGAGQLIGFVGGTCEVDLGFGKVYASRASVMAVGKLSSADEKLSSVVAKHDDGSVGMKRSSSSLISLQSFFGGGASAGIREGEQVWAVGSEVSTFMGLAHVEHFDVERAMYELRTDFDARIFVSAHKLNELNMATPLTAQVERRGLLSTLIRRSSSLLSLSSLSASLRKGKSEKQMLKEEEEVDQEEEVEQIVVPVGHTTFSWNEEHSSLVHPGLPGC